MNQKSVVILLSDKRSGSTMFQDEICRHQDVRTVDYSPHTYLETHHWLKGAVLLGMAPETFGGGRVYAGYGSRANARTYMIDCIRGNVPDFQPPSDDRELVFAGWEALCERFAQPVFFEKSPQVLGHWAALSLLLEWMNQTRFKVRIIGLTRNPLSVQYSAYQLFHTEPGRRQYGWLEGQKNLLAIRSMIPADSFLHVRYEDIIQQPRQTFSAVCDFIGVPPAEEIGAGVHGESLNKWKKDPDFTLRLDGVVKQMAVEFGYSDQDLDNPVKPGPALSARVRRKLTGFVKLARGRIKDRIIKPFLMDARRGRGG